MSGVSVDDLSQRFQRQLTKVSGIQRWIIALSGGLDSMVLLELAARFLPAKQVTVLHVNHQLQSEAGEWQLFCAQQAEQRGLTFRAEKVQLEGGSVETAARNARYSVFEDEMSSDVCLMMAHHADDQAETLLFRLLRGAGVRGMAAMAVQRKLNNGKLLRPLLGCSRSELKSWAIREGLSWVEDPSNSDTQYDRNYLRQQVLPLLAKRWPRVNERLNATACHLADAEALLEELAQADLEACLASANTLSLTELKLLSGRRQVNALRYWSRQFGLVLSEGQVDSLRVMAEAAADSQPELLLGDTVIRRYRSKLYIDPVTESSRWQECLIDVLASGLSHGGVLTLKSDAGKDLDSWLMGVDIRSRQEGDKCHPLGRPGKSLKHLFQEAGVPPWQRDNWPVCIRAGEIVAIPGICICQSWCDGENKPPFWLDWQPSALFAVGDSGTL